MTVCSRSLSKMEKSLIFVALWVSTIASPRPIRHSRRRFHLPKKKRRDPSASKFNQHRRKFELPQSYSCNLCFLPNRKNRTVLQKKALSEVAVRAGMRQVTSYGMGGDSADVWGRDKGAVIIHFWASGTNEAS